MASYVEQTNVLEVNRARPMYLACPCKTKTMHLFGLFSPKPRLKFPEVLVFPPLWFATVSQQSKTHLMNKLCLLAKSHRSWVC